MGPSGAGILRRRRRADRELTGNVFLLIFVASLGSDLPWPEVIGGAIVYGLLAGAVLHFFVDLFTVAGAEPLMVGVTILVYVAGRRFLEPRVPALLSALAWCSPR